MDEGGRTWDELQLLPERPLLDRRICHDDRAAAECRQSHCVRHGLLDDG
jgi:hypothetical protein